MLKFKNSDFLMARRSKQRLSRQNKDRGGCMSGLVSIFDFRHGRITRRMLSDHATHLTESTTGPSYPTSEVNSITDSEEMHLRIESLNGEKGETVRTRVKELMEEEMYTDQTSDLECDGHVHTHEPTEKTPSPSFDSCEISKDRQLPPQKTPEYHDLKDLVNELLLIHQKRNEEQKPKSIERSNSLENERNNPKSDEPVIHKPRNFFRRRSKSHECISLNVNDSPLPSNRTNGLHSERSTSQFSFTEIKRKLKNAIGRSPRDSGCFRENPIVDGSSGWSSPHRDHFFSERFSRISDEFKTQDGVSKLRKSEANAMENNEFGDTSYRISNIYIEAKKHLSEILRNEDEDTEFMEARHSRTLGKLLSFPEYNDSPRANSPMVNESQPFGVENDHQEPEVLDEVVQTEGVLEIVKPPSQIDIEVVDVADLTEDDELSCSPPASPSGSSLAVNRKTEEVENTTDDKTEKPSPVSVLEPMFSDDDISPARTISRSAEASIQPLRIRFEEPVPPAKNQETRIRNHVENDESAFEYVEAVLLASDLNWDDFEKRWLSSTQILDLSLYDELQIFSSQPAHDQRLLFDSTNEILKEVCDRFLGFFPDLPFVKPNIHPLPKGMDLINEVWERIESRIYGPYSRSLDQLIRKDLEVSRMWMDLRSETRDIVIDIEELMFEDLIDDTLSSLMRD